MNFGLGPSNASGGPEEENVFHVTQTHMLDQPKELQLKVGDTGISFLHNGRMVQVQPYEALSRWAFEADLKRLVIGLKDPPKELTMFTDDPKTVCLAMQTQATSYAATKRKLRRDTAHASEDTPEEGDPRPPRPPPRSMLHRLLTRCKRSASRPRNPATMWSRMAN